MIRLELEDRELDFIGMVLGAVPTHQSVQAGMIHLIPKLQEQASASIAADRQRQQEIDFAMAEAAKP